MERRIRFIFCVFSEDSDMGSVTLDQYYLWPMVWSRRRWSLHWGPAVTETLPSYTNPQSEGRLGWVPGLRHWGVLKVWRECGEVFGAGWWRWWLDCSSKWIKVSGCHGHKDNVQGEKKKGGMGVWWKKRVNKGGMRARMGQRREEVRRGNVRQFEGERKGGRGYTPK